MSELKITFLGTGSGRPTPRRNVAGVYLQYGGDAVQLDCGEGSQMQLLRAGLRTSRLVAVCITHFHGDHINGLPGYLGTMGMNDHGGSITVVAPEGVDAYFRVLHDLQILRPAFPIQTVPNNDGPLFRGDGFRIDGVRLRHRIPTHGFIFREDDHPGRFDLDRARALGVPAGPLFGRLQRGHTVTLEDGTEVAPDQVLGPSRAGRSIAYISDTRPSDRVVEAVRGVDILIHEATYLHELAGQARERGHSTVREAAEIARSARVKRLVLTHISPKHPNARQLLAEAHEVFDTVDVAEDLSSFEVPVPA